MLRIDRKDLGCACCKHLERLVHRLCHNNRVDEENGKQHLLRPAEGQRCRVFGNAAVFLWKVTRPWRKQQALKYRQGEAAGDDDEVRVSAQPVRQEAAQNGSDKKELSGKPKTVVNDRVRVYGVFQGLRDSKLKELILRSSQNQQLDAFSSLWWVDVLDCIVLMRKVLRLNTMHTENRVVRPLQQTIRSCIWRF